MEGGCVNVCDKFAEIALSAMSDGCLGKDDLCWHCDCYHQNKYVNVETVGSEVIYSCQEMLPCVDDPDTPRDECDTSGCEGEFLHAASRCVFDEANCWQHYFDAQVQFCDDTPK